MLKRLFWPRRRHLVALVVVFSGVLLIVHFTTANSEAYLFADEFVAKDERIGKLTGRQSERSLLWRKGFDLSYGDNSGQAELTFKVTAERGEFGVPMKLAKKDGRWSVIGASVEAERGDAIVIVAASQTQ